MKELKLKMVWLLFPILLFSCSSSSSDDKKTYLPEDPFDAFMTATGFTQTATGSGSDAEFGYKFKPVGNGEITAVSARTLNANSAVRVTIWDVATAAVLQTEFVDVAVGGTFATENITPLSVTKDTEYMISICSGDTYTYTAPGSVAYPVTVGNIRITGAAYRGYTAGAQLFPPDDIGNTICGDMSFTFKRID